MKNINLGLVGITLLFSAYFSMFSLWKGAVALIILSFINIINFVLIKNNYEGGRAKNLIAKSIILIGVTNIYIVFMFEQINGFISLMLVASSASIVLSLTAFILGMVRNLDFTMDNNKITSFLNPKNLKRGFKWSDINEIKSTLNTGIVIDNFQVIENIDRFGKKAINEIEKTIIRIPALDFTKTILAIGKAGSGKTEFFMNLVSQNTDFNYFKRELYHDVKGDFVQKLYNKDTDFILNPFDNRGLIWDIWKDMKHNEALVVSFIQNLIVSQVKEADFWTSSASKLLSDSIMRVHFTFGAKLTSAEKWDKLLEVLEDYKNNINDDKTKQSIWQTLELGLEYVNLLAFQTKKATKLFSIYEWCNETNTRLFLLNNASYSKKLNPYFTGFLACIIEVLLSKGDTKTDLTLLLLDEYLSLKLDESVRLKLMTQIRSKGGCCVLGVQYIDASDKKQKQLISSSTFAKILFNVADDETIDTFVKAYGIVEYENQKTSTSTSTQAKERLKVDNAEDAFFKIFELGGSKKHTSFTTSMEDKNRSFLTPSIIKNINNFRHITFIDELNIYYVGYTSLIQLDSINKHFEKLDLTAFYEWLYNKESANQNINKEILEVENIDETQKYLVKPFEERLSIYTDLKECIESNDTALMDKIIKKWKLENVDIEKFIDDFEA